MRARELARHLGLGFGWMGFAIVAAAPQVGQIVPSAPTPPGQVGPVRDRVPAVQSGTAVLKGRVVDGVTGAAIARARVRIMGGAAPRPAVVTDDDGAFAFTNLPPGGYFLTVDKSTFMNARYPVATGSLRASARPLTVKDGQVLEAITVPLFHGGAITGHVFEAHGDPVEYAEVRVLRIGTGSGAGPSMRGGSSTNDLGEFRVPRLEPGRYLVMVVPRRMMEEPPVEGQQLAQPLPTYYPGVMAIEQAQPITIERGQPAVSLDIVLGEGFPTVVTGMVVTSDGRALAGNGFLNARSVVKNVAGFVDSGAGTGVRPDGSFRLVLPPGEYELEAHVMANSGQPTQLASEQFGSTRVSVGGPTIDGVTIVIGRGATATGRVVFEGTTPPPAAPGGQVRVPLFSTEGVMCRSGQAQVAPDWTFKIDGLAGTCMAPPSMFGRWFLKAVLNGTEDLSTRRVTFEPGQQFRNIEIVVTDRRTELAFRVDDDEGQPTREYVAIVFPVEKERWELPNRFVRTFVPPSIEMMRPNTSAPARAGMPATPTMRPELLTGLPAGEYYAVALDDIESERARDPAVFEHLISSSVRVTLEDGSRAEVPLHRVRRSAVLPSR